MDQFLFETPEKIGQLVNCLRDADSQTYILSGGTDMVIRFANLGIYSGKIIDMSGIGELNYIRQQDGFIKIGANTTFTEIGESELINKYAACLGEVSRQVGSPQIRNSARIAGNIANSSPGGDSIPALLALDAIIKIVNGNGETICREIDEIVVGIGKNNLKKDEAIIEIMIPYREEGNRSAFCKYGMGSSRTTVVIANISVTAVINLDLKTGNISEASIVLGASAPVCYHAVKAEKLLIGKKPTRELGEAFANMLQEHVEESINGISTFKCKIDDVKGLGLTLFEKIFEDILLAGGDN